MTRGQYWHEMIVKRVYTRPDSKAFFVPHRSPVRVSSHVTAVAHERTNPHLLRPVARHRIRQPGARAHRTGGQPGICILGDSMKLIASARGDSMKLIASCIGGGGATRCSDDMTNGRAGIW